MRSSSQDCCPRWEPRVTTAWPQLTCPLSPQGVNELKVFVDLAFIFAGENDMDVDRVACFHDAVQGYSSLLYKLDASQGFQAFAGHLKELWKALDSDPHLPSKLVSLVPRARLPGTQAAAVRTVAHHVLKTMLAERLFTHGNLSLAPVLQSDTELLGNTRDFY